MLNTTANLMVALLFAACIAFVGCEDDFDINILSPVALGQGVPEAATYDPTQPGPHKAVVLSSSGTSHDWHDLLPDGWRASSVKETQLVVLVSPQREVAIESCDYNFGPDIVRYRFEVDVTLCSAQRAATIGTTMLQGSDPSSCPSNAPIEQTRIDGSYVGHLALQEWLRQYIE